MTERRRGAPDSPGFRRGAETGWVLKARLEEAIRRFIPGASEEQLQLACLFVQRTVRLADARRQAEQHPQTLFSTVHLEQSRRMKEEVERELLDSGVEQDTLDRIAELYALAQDYLRKLSAELQLEAEHGCAKCRHGSSSWERSGGEKLEDDDRFPICDVYGEVPAFCFHFEPTRFCSKCGTSVAPKPFQKGDPVPVECGACKGPW